MLDVHEIALELVREVAPIAIAIGRHDAGLARQFRAAMTYPRWTTKTVDVQTYGAAASPDEFVDLVKVHGSELLDDLKILKITPARCAMTAIQLRGVLNPNPGAGLYTWLWDLTCKGKEPTLVDARSGALLSK